MGRIKDKEKHSKYMKKAGAKHSISRQITLIFVIVMAFTIGAILLIFNVFLEKIYVADKEKTLYSALDTLNYAAGNELFEDEDTDNAIRSFSSINNLSIIVITEGLEPFKVFSSEPQEQLLMELRSNLTGKIQVEEILNETDAYVLIRKLDGRTQNEYLEMWGVLSDGSFFMMRIAMESIRNSVALSSRFLIIVGLASILISSVIIYVVTRKLTKPIKDITEISERVSDMDFEAKYQGHSKTEIGLLGNSINKMSENLENTISDLKAANLKLQADIDEKTKLDAMRQEFISSVSHELKTPIALIQGYAEGLKEGVNDESDRDYYCDIIMDESSKMNNMVRKLLSLNQLESGEEVMSIDRFDVVTLINNYIKNADIMIKQKEVKVNVEEHNPIFVWADEFRIEEVFMNYFTNALNHCESDSEKHIDISFEIEENKVRVNVFNTGNNIPEESINYLWDKFYKVDKARTRAYGGSGVGLSIVKAIMEAHEQEYGVENKEDGVLFYFTLDTSNK